MARISRQAPIVKDIATETQEHIDGLLRLLAKTGPRVQRYEVRTIVHRGDPRPTLFLTIVGRWRANTDSESLSGHKIPRTHLATYLEHVPAIVRALEFFAERGGLFGLCRELNARGLSAVECRDGRGAFLWFPLSAPPLVPFRVLVPPETNPDIPELTMGSRCDDIAEAILVLLSHDDPQLGVEAVRRLR